MDILNCQDFSNLVAEDYQKASVFKKLIFAVAADILWNFFDCQYWKERLSSQVHIKLYCQGFIFQIGIIVGNFRNLKLQLAFMQS